ncbi:MAG: hypothetical protein ACO1OB_03530 [Archangium sp.]
MRALALISAVMFAGCFNPDDILPIKGKLETAGQRVQLSRAVNPEGGDCTDYKRLKTVDAGDDGSFTLDVFRAQATNIATFELYCFKVETTYDNGTHVASTMEQLVTEVSLLDFPRWEPNLRREDGEFRFAPVAQRREDGSLIVQHFLEVKRDEQVVWRTSDLVLGGFTTVPLSAPVRADPRIYDEFGGTLTMKGSFAEIPKDIPNPVDVDLDELVIRPPVDAVPTDSLTLVRGLVPPSRGAACSSLASPCGLTDGALSAVELGGAQSVTIELSQPMTPSLIVVRALVTNSQLVAAFGTTSDGGVVPFGAYPLLRQGDPPGASADEPAPTFVSMAFDAGVEVRSVSVAGESLIRVDEISVW